MKNLPILAAICLLPNLHAQEKTATKTTTKTIDALDISTEMREQASSGIAYLKGKQLAVELLNEGYQLDDFSPEAMQKGFMEAISQKDSTVKISDFQVAVNLAKAKLQERELKLSKTNMKASEAWLEDNSMKEGVKQTTSGLQYKVVKKGEVEVAEKDKVKAGDERYFISYQSANTDGIVFETSPPEKLVGVGENLLPGLAEALKLMKTGDHWQLYLKPELAYGNRRVGASLEPGSIVVMDVMLAGIQDAQAAQK